MAANSNTMLFYGRHGRLLKNPAYIFTILIKVLSSGMSGVSINLQLTKTYSEKTTGFSDFASISLKSKVTPHFFGSANKGTEGVY